MDRREFIFVSFITNLMAACNKKALAGKAARNESIVIIGAGMAGLASARTLHDLGYSVTLLEAKDRIGGRVWTSHLWPEAAVDLGASWIHGEKSNPLTKLADKIGAKRLPTDYDNSILYGQEGHLVRDSAELEMNRLYEKLIRSINFNASVGKSIFDVLEKTPLWIKLSQQQRQSVMHLMNTWIEHELGGPLNQISATSPDDVGEFPGEDVIFPGGYSALTDYLAKDLNIELEQVVEKITYRNDELVVKTKQGEFQADRIIVSLPIGVLKANSVQFDPQLPPQKQKSIADLGAGLLDKLFLKFPYVFWEENKEIINWISTEPGRWNEWLNLSAYINQPILLGFNAADYAKKTETWTDEKIVSDAMSVLRTIYGNNIPQPMSWQITRWAADPFARCSYSFNAVGANIDSRISLSKSINNRMFFAGEATSENYPATVHGAYLSGIKAAAAIADF